MVQDAAAAEGSNYIEVQLRARLLWLQHCLPQLNGGALVSAETSTGKANSNGPAGAAVLRPAVVKVYSYSQALQDSVRNV